MSTDMLTNTISAKRRRSRPGFSLGRWRKRAFLAIGLLAVGASATVLIPDSGLPRESGPRLTHTVTRGDLIITVTERGTLESSVNTEIKCKVRGGDIPILWVIENGTEVKPGDELVNLEALAFEDRLNEMSKFYHLVKSGAERTREIGIRRALGAGRKHIIQQFLTETVVLTASGGLLGVLFGLLCGPLFRTLRSAVTIMSPDLLPPIVYALEPRIAPWSVVLSLVISLGVGIVFGVYPVRQAAYMNPIEALRHE